MMRKNIVLLSDEELNVIENAKMNIEADENLEESSAAAAGLLFLAALLIPHRAY